MLHSADDIIADAAVFEIDDGHGSQVEPAALSTDGVNDDVVTDTVAGHHDDVGVGDGVFGFDVGGVSDGGVAFVIGFADNISGHTAGQSTDGGPATGVTALVSDDGTEN